MSGEHATIAWTGKHWEIRDLGSRNGTYVDGTRIESGRNVRLMLGTQVAFGDLRAGWTVVDDSAPSIMAIHLSTGIVQSGPRDLLVLPSVEAPEVSIYRDADGGWWMDAGQTAERLEDQQTISSPSGDWMVLLPSVEEGTPLLDAQLPFDAVELRFAVDRREERVNVTVFAHGIEKHLAEREHGYVLLTLARARREDAELPVEQRGWRDRETLERMLGMDGNALNVAIHRARQQLSTAGVQGAAKVVEVRPRQRRFGTDRFRIETWCPDAS